MKKIALLLLAIFVCIAAFSSCKVKNKDKQNGDGGSNAVTVDGVIWSPTVTLGMVNESGLEWGANDFFYEIYELTGQLPVFVGEDAEEYAHEFVFGNTKREISAKAYKMLDRIMTDSDCDVGWLIYSDGNSIAIAFNANYGMKAALEYINENFMSQRTLTLSAGVVASDSFNLEEYAAEYREEKRAEYFDELEEELGKEITDEIRKLFSLYTDDVYVWLANLYDPEIGGFYYSNSGRDNVGYLPDIESTVQALNHLRTGGMFAERGGNYSTALPEEMQEQLLSFAKGLQSPVDGFFYHPQWGENIIAARRGRDLGWATDLITQLGSKPLYNTPGGVKGELGAPPGVQPVSSLTGRLSDSGVTSVSKVIAASSNLPAYLQSLDAWAIYIDSLNLPNDSYVAGNTLAAQHNEIKAAGREYIDYLINYLNETQIPELGLWEAIPEGKDTDHDPNDGVNYANVNGLMKIASVYNYYNVPVPNLENALRSCIKVALYPNDEGDAHVCCTYNPWVIMTIVLNSARIAGGEELVEEMRSIILENAAELVAATFDKLVPHVREDGCFSYFEKILSHASQKALVACASVVESDVNATAICTTGIVSNMCSAFGIEKIPLYYDPDCEYFLSIINNLGKIEKNPAEPVETVTFDNADGAEKEYGVVTDPDTSMTIKVNDKTLDGAVYKYTAADIVADPFPSKKNDLALKVNTYTYKNPDGTSDLSASATSILTSITNNYVVGNTYSFSADYLVTKANDGCFMQMFFTRSVEDPSHSFGLNFSAYTQNGVQYVKIGDGYDGPDGDRDGSLVVEIPIGEWFSFRVDVYKIYEEIEDGATGKTLNIIAKLYLNGEFVGTSEASYTSSTNPTVVSEKTIGAIILSMYRFNPSEVYIDNVHAEKLDKQYEETVLPPEEPPAFVATPAGTRGEGAYYTKYQASEAVGKVYNYNNGEKKPALSNNMDAKTYIAGIPTEENVTPTDPYLFFYRTGGTGIHESITYKFGTNTKPENAESLVSIVEADLAFGNISESYAVMFMIYSGGFRTSAYLSVSGEGVGFEFGAEASRFTPLPQNEWLNLTFETYLVDPEKAPSNDNVRTKVYINGEFKIELSGVDVSATTSEQVVIQLQYKEADAWLCLDNLYLGYIDKAFVAATEPVPEGLPAIAEGNWGSGAYYHGENAGARYGYDNGELKPAIASGSATAKTYLSEDVKKVVYFYKSLEGDVVNSQSTLMFKLPTEIPEGATGIIFEADMAFSGFSNYSGEKQAPGFQITFNKDKWLASYFIGNNGEGKITSFFGKVAAGENFILEENVWVNVRMVVYMGNGNTKTVAKVYIDGEYVCDLNPGDDKASSNSSNTLSFVLRQFESDDWLAYDNLYIGYTTEAYTAPEGGDGGNEGENGGNEGGTDDEPTEPEIPTVTVPTINGTKGNGAIYSGEFEGIRVDMGNISTPNVGSLAVSAIIDKDFLYVAKNTPEGVENAQSNLPKYYFPTKPDTALGYVVEFDIALGELSSTNVQLDLGMGGMYGSIYLYSPDAESTVSSNWGTVAAGTNISLAQGKWYNIRLVAYDVSGVITFKIYINGEYACDLMSADRGKDSTSDYFVITLRQLDTDNWVAVDNLYLGYTVDAYVYGDPDSYVDTPEGITGDENKGKGEYYNGDYAGTRLDGTSAGSIDVSMLGDDAKLELTKDGAILFRKDVTDTQGKSYIRINLPTAPTGAVASVVEFDMMMSTTMNENKAGLVFMMESLGYRGDIFFKSNGETYTSGHPSYVKSGSNISVKQGEWHNIRIVTYTVDEVVIFKVYVDGVYTMDIRTANNTKTSSNKILTLYMQELDENNDDFILVDNIYLGYTDVAYVEGAGN